MEISPKNNIQDTKIAKLEVQISHLDERFDKFITNDFHDLKEKVKELDKRVWYILAVLILGFLASITVNILI